MGYNIAHMVLWSTHHMEKSRVNTIIEDAYPNMHYLWWENPIKKRSVPDVHHVQILIKMKETDQASLLLQGFIKQILKDSTYQTPMNLLREFRLFTIV